MTLKDTIEFEVTFPISDATQDKTQDSMVKSWFRKVGLLAPETTITYKFKALKRLSAFDEIKKTELSRKWCVEAFDEEGYYERLNVQVDTLVAELGIEQINRDYAAKRQAALAEYPLGKFGKAEEQERLENDRIEVVKKIEKERMDAVNAMLDERKNNIEMQKKVAQLISAQQTLGLFAITAELEVALVDMPEAFYPLHDQESSIIYLIWAAYQAVVSPFRLSWFVPGNKPSPIGRVGPRTLG
jgi:hypothetical protein